ncbi:hypothetical protein SCHPADRAFT_945990 [Schizopora paradoxa]|uniref:Uncharacterized protein n=1 Tax=Schizopora paradoxa TaxID=27342 RepID=A0A0H2RAP2_9AGAM|nr:hypothetical protein SCHPADRAFT_945990 [Schizopora paradoxa]
MSNGLDGEYEAKRDGICREIKIFKALLLPFTSWSSNNVRSDGTRHPCRLSTSPPIFVKICIADLTFWRNLQRINVFHEDARISSTATDPSTPYRRRRFEQQQAQGEDTSVGGDAKISRLHVSSRQALRRVYGPSSPPLKSSAHQEDARLNARLTVIDIRVW